MEALRIRVPATTANLGAGYDLIGAALNLYNQFVFEPAEELNLVLSGPRAQECHFAFNTESLIWRAFTRVYAAAGQSPPLFRLSQEVHVPPARGLGSSSSAIVAGLLAANRWLGNPLGQQDLLVLATEIEGHPDNVAPALLGGCILNFTGGAWTRLPVPDKLHWIVAIPNFELETKKARQAVPQQVALADAVANMAFLSALVTGLCLNDEALIARGLDDTLHQPYRRALVPGMPEVMRAATAAGALGCVLSGAGPTLLALHSDDDAGRVGQAMVDAWSAHGITSSFVTCVIDPQGAVCLD